MPRLRERGWTLLFVATSMLVAVSAFAFEPVSVSVFGSGEVAVLDPYRGIMKYYGASWARAKIVENFGAFEAADFASDGATSVFVSLNRPGKSNDPFSRVARYSNSGKRLGEWTVGRMGASLTGITFDPARQVLYCIDSRAGEIFQLDLRKPRATFVSLLTVPNAGIPGPLLFDAARARLLLGDVERGRILAVNPATKRVEVLLDSGTIVEPTAMALDARGTLYIADAAKQRVWAGNLAPRLTVKPFATTESFEEPVGVALGASGTIWIVDRGESALLQFAPDGKRLRTIDVNR